jgi:hypothetical protein
MSPSKTDRSNCQFSVQEAPDDKVVIVVRLLHETIPALKNAVVGFDLLGGIRIEQTERIAYY